MSLDASLTEGAVVLGAWPPRCAPPTSRPRRRRSPWARRSSSASGAYIVTRDNFGLLPAQVAGVALLTDYVLTVSVSVAAGTAALTSAAPALTSFAVPISVAFIVFIAYGNLRGVRESGRMFSVPTYFFIGTMIALLAIGLARMVFGHLPVESLHHAGLVKIGHKGNGFLMGATLFIVMRAFASGGAAVTGVEAI